MKSCKGKFALCLVVCLAVILGTRMAFGATVSIPTGLEGIVDTMVMVPVNIDSAVSLSAYNLVVGYDPNVLDFVGLLPIAVSEKDLPAGGEHPVDPDNFYFIGNEDPNAGTVTIGVVNFYPVAKSGVLMYLKFSVERAATDSPLTVSIVTDPGNDLSGSLTSAGSITTDTALPGTCQIRAVMATVPAGEVLVNLKAEGVGITQRWLWNTGEDPNVVFIVDPGTYQIIAQSEGYETYYSADLDCNQNSANVVISTPLKYSYTVTRKDVKVDPNTPGVRLTFNLFDNMGTLISPWDTGTRPLTLQFYNAVNDANGDGKADTAGLLDPNGPIVSPQLNANNQYVYTVNLGDANFRMTDWTGANRQLGYDAYVIAFRTESTNTAFLNPNKVRIHRYIVRAVYSEKTNVAAASKSSVNLKKELFTKGYINIQMDTNAVSAPAIAKIVKDPNTISLNLEFDMSLADIALFTDANDTVIDPNTDLEVSIEYHTGAGAGLTAASPGVVDPNDVIVISIDFTDPDTGGTVVYNADMSTAAPLISFDIPLPAALQDPNLEDSEMADRALDISENHLITAQGQQFLPGRYGLYIMTSGSNVPVLFIPEGDEEISVSWQGKVFIATIKTHHASLWYVGSAYVPIEEGGGGTCFINGVMKE